MKEPAVKSNFNRVANRSNSVPRYYNGENEFSPMYSDGHNDERTAGSTIVSPPDYSNAQSHFRNRDRLQSTNENQQDAENEKHRKKNSEFENRRRYIATILERYYSHPSNRQRSLPSNVRNQIFDALVPDMEIAQRKTTSGTVPEDSASEDSSAFSSHRTEGHQKSGIAGGSPDSSRHVGDEERHSTTKGEKRKKKSRFFRSSSMRSLKKWMNKLRGKSGQNSASNMKGQLDSHAPLSSMDIAICNNNISAPTCDSGLETPTETDSNKNKTNSSRHDRNNSTDIISSTNQNDKNIASMIDIPTPALCGIMNHGNTCYINAVVQCLSNTDLLAEYFLSGQYLTDLKNNLRNADRYGSQGNVTLALARFFKALWFSTYAPNVSSSFKAIVERYSEQYRGNQQQDAQEFFYWLVDRVHEDLNVAVKRRYKLHKSRNKNEDELAAAAMEKHLEAHNSFISARFHGLLMSTVACPICRKQSMKPDPFMCISLPVSQCTKRPLFVVVTFINRQPRKVRYGLNADITATFLEVKRCLADATDLSVEQLLLCEMNESGFQSSLLDHHEVISLGNTKCIWAFEIPISMTNLMRSPVLINQNDELTLLVGNQVLSSGGNGLKFGTPVVLRISREATYEDLSQSVLFVLRPQFRPGLSLQEISPNAFRMRIVDDYHPFVYIASDVSMPLYTQAVDSALSSITGEHSSASIPHLKLMLEWHRDAKDRYFSPGEERTVDHISAQDLRDQEEHPEIQSIHDCLAEYTRPDLCQWYCPDCRRRQENATKRIVFYWLPDVLVLHLKRFKQLSSGQLVKLDSTVWFPVSDLDLSDYTHQSISRNQKGQQHRSAQAYHKMQNGELYVDTRPSQNLYDLYAVCNHSGHSPHSGHYTAFCRNPVNGRWYCFDDQNVTAIKERDLVTNDAYLLFYERRQLRKGSNSHNSAESGFVDHWFFRVYSNHLTDRDRSSYSSKDTLDGTETNGCSSGGTTGQQRSPIEANQGPPEGVHKAATTVKGNDHNLDSISKKEAYGAGNEKRCETSSNVLEQLREDKRMGKQCTSFARPSYVSVGEPTTTISLQETSPVSNDGSTTITAESASLNTGSTIGSNLERIESAHITSTSSSRVEPLERHISLIPIKIKADQDMNSEAEDNVFVSSSKVADKKVPSGGHAGQFRRSSTSSDIITHRYRTCSVVETDL